MSGKKTREATKEALHELQIDLARLQKHLISSDKKVLVIFEGRDASGKDGTIKRIIEHLSPRETRVVALGKPSDRDQKSWYFQRWVPHLPASGEIVLFNRSWYNRAGVERVMGFCTNEEYDEFLMTAPLFEQLLAHCGVTILKYYLDISQTEQKVRLKDRRDDPLKQWKLSPIDDAATKHWDDYSAARNEMLARTHTPFAPWTVVRADDKPSARLNVIRDLLTRFDFEGKDRAHDLPDPNIVFLYDKAAITNGLIAE
ncbi:MULTISPECIES: polyphosphate kinase 2 [Xanthobacteraceae]|uniref:polyphosphate kinase 2 n=1 Tax=Xanthobacteraceae TaxID=335928 RepID=UPI001E3BD74C|nr:polyphosphate kinase 2 [Xanthobacter autotrophicus]UDQ88537.1 polyphosphate kinase 2 [Xanthobacter autotrophicus]